MAIQPHTLHTMRPAGPTNKGTGAAASCHCDQLRGQIDGHQAPAHCPQHVQRWNVQGWVGQHARQGPPKCPDRHVAQEQVDDACSATPQRKWLRVMPMFVQRPTSAALGSSRLSDRAGWLKLTSHR